METTELANAIGPALARAIAERGFSSLTPVQQAVLTQGAHGRDLRVSSQTGSGKTVALGLAIREEIAGEASSKDNHARPRALVLVPTRELAKQVRDELTWLFSVLDVRVACVTGGGGYRDELRSFRQGPAVVVGTPGRLRDHLERGSLDPSNVAAVVLDEADRMLDLGFRDEILAIFAALPEEKRVHLVSATFPREVRVLADRVQANPEHVMGTPLGAANADIEHVLHLVPANERLDAIVNILLADPGAQTLIFAHTRADVADLGASLADLGFSVGTLSGEMEQAERNRALVAFKRGHLDAMVATDVAARGIDVADVACVIHADAPTDADAYTHRSGRTGRAGRKGRSLVLVTPPALVRTLRTLERARVDCKILPVPSKRDIRRAQHERWLEELTASAAQASTSLDEDLESLAEKCLASTSPKRIVAELLRRMQAKGPEPRDVTAIAPPAERKRDRSPMGGERFSPRGAEPRAPRGDDRAPSRRAMSSGEPGWRPFRVTWGTTQGADARRLLAVVCRRGNIRGSDVGAIRLAPTFSVVEVKAEVADQFEQEARVPDPRAPRVLIRPWSEQGPAGRTHERRGAHESRQAAESAPMEPLPPEERGVAPAERTIPSDRPSRRKPRASTATERPNIVQDAPFEAPVREPVRVTNVERSSRPRLFGTSPSDVKERPRSAGTRTSPTDGHEVRKRTTDSSRSEGAVRSEPARQNTRHDTRGDVKRGERFAPKGRPAEDRPRDRSRPTRTEHPGRAPFRKRPR